VFSHRQGYREPISPERKLSGQHLLIVIAAMLGFMSGCGSSGDNPDLGRVQGVVTLDGKPVANAEISFSPVNGERYSIGKTDERGHYSLSFSANDSGAAVGEHVVKILSEEADLETSEDPVLPAAYNSESQLKVNVKSGSNTIDFPLKADGSLIAIQ